MGPAIILIPGTLTTADDMWIALADRLSSVFRVIALKRPGYGYSARLAKPR